jgi:hypothetical protein
MYDLCLVICMLFRYALSLITTDVKKSTPQLDTALQRIQALKGKCHLLSVFSFHTHKLTDHSYRTDEANSVVSKFDSVCVQMHLLFSDRLAFCIAALLIVFYQSSVPSASLMSAIGNSVS